MNKKVPAAENFELEFIELKKRFAAKTDKDLAIRLGIRQQAVAGAKKRRHIPDRWYRKAPMDGELLQRSSSIIRSVRSSYYIGAIGRVEGTELTIYLDPNTVLPNRGKWVIGPPDIGAIIRIPVGTLDILAIVTRAGASGIDTYESGNFVNRFLIAELWGQINEGSFQKGVRKTPRVGSEAFIASDEELTKIVNQNGSGLVKFGIINNMEIPFLLNVPKLLSCHTLITQNRIGHNYGFLLKEILRAISCIEESEIAQLYVFDLQGDVASSLSTAAVLSPNPRSVNEKQFYMPFWALKREQVIRAMQAAEVDHEDIQEVAKCLRKLRLLGSDKEIDMCGKKMINNDNLVRVQDILSALAITRYEFIFEPGPWSIKEGCTLPGKFNTSALVGSWIEQNRRVVVFDFSTIPRGFQLDAFEECLRILSDCLIEQSKRPSTIVLTEADLYLKRKNAIAIINYLARRGRTHDISLLLECQRPFNIDRDLLRQIGNIIVERLQNIKDSFVLRHYGSQNIGRLSDIGLILGEKEIYAYGEAFPLPLRLSVTV